MLSFENKLDKILYYYFFIIMLLFPFIVVLKDKNHLFPVLVLAGGYTLAKGILFLSGKSSFSLTLLPTALIGIILAALICLYHYSIYGYTEIFYFVRYFSLPFIILFFFLFDYNAYRFTKYHLIHYLLYLFIVICGFIVFDYTLIHFFNLAKYKNLIWLFSPVSYGHKIIHMLWKVRCSFSTIDFCRIIFKQHINHLTVMQALFGQDWRPAGLIGKPAVTSTLVIFLYLLYRYLLASTYNMNKLWLNNFIFLLLTLTILLQNSGTGFILYLFLLTMLLLGRLKMKKYLFLIMIVFFVVIFSGAFYRLDFHYIIRLISLTYTEVTNYLNKLTFLSLLLGNSYPYNGAAFGYLFIISCMGLIYFIYYYSFVFRIIVQAKNKWLTAALTMLIIADLHYTVSFYYPLSPLLLALLAMRIYLTEENYQFFLEKNLMGYFFDA